MRVALISQVTPAVEGYTQLLRALGHEPVGVLCVRTGAATPTSAAHVSAVRRTSTWSSRRAGSGFAPLLAALEPDSRSASASPGS